MINCFKNLKCLSPSRSCDLHVILEPNTKPVVVGPYCYLHMQKDKIERQCIEMLKQGIICSGQSPFSSPVLLVSKVDVPWRICVDYLLGTKC